MAWGYGRNGAQEVPDNEVSPRHPNREEAAHLPTAGFASHTYNHDSTQPVVADESRVRFRLS
jgi:hypothetical protein